MRWEPGRDWTLLAAGTDITHGGVWRTPDRQVVKRLIPGDDRPSRYAYWRRQAELASSGLLELTSGLRAPRFLKAETDPDGITLWFEAVAPSPVTPEEAAAALGRFGLNQLEPARWFSRQILRDRLADDAVHGGWAACATAEDLPAGVRRSCGLLWTRREEVLAELDRLPQLPVHGDAHPLNLLRRDGNDVIAADWDQFGIGPLGFDLGYLLQSTRAPAENLVAAYQAGSSSAFPAEQVRRGAVLTAAITLVARAAWALAQPDPVDHVLRLTELSPIVEEAVNHPS
ncbi:phosphotransferase family protein [Kribbella sp. NPDC004875]|uniref:phosphotransferase family protein n=1 Tax=Kribbella sp. NPDC004875 TaxID=3364107 RepID=UPI0036916B89